MPETLQSVREDVLYHLGDPDQTLWRNAEVDSYIKQGYNDLVRRSLCVWTWDWLNDVASTAVYDLPTDLIVVDRMTWNNERIEPWVPRRLQAADPNYRTKEGRVLSYLVEEDGVAHVRLYPVPSSTATADQDINNTRIEYFRRGGTLTEDTDEFDLPSWAVKYCRYFAMYMCLDRKGKAQDPKMAAHYQARYEEGVSRLKRRKQLVTGTRIGGFREEGVRDVRPPRPRMPWAYGRVVR